ncbi:DUF2868 domain-containing protein [Castellaniella caeni]|uniref:DUF2868 domain-containing protein n=1 Tax=Castellaniella caeni TaxID=266123 RepID=UPI000835F93B|nr:DUF2868 domain-containing protein [Castellaniella caeni]
MRNASSSLPDAPASPLFQHWRAEAVRLREAHWGPLEDQAACQAALRVPAGLQDRILARAAWLAAHGTLQQRLRQWAASARWALIGLWLAAGLAGIGAASAALDHAQGSVNLAAAIIGLLGLHALTFLIWLAGCLPGLHPSTTLSRLWLWLTRKLAHGPDSALAAQAFVSLLNRARAWKPALGLLSHGAWSIAYLTALPTLLVLLSTRRYTFHWETTLLSPDAFVALSRLLGSVPQWLGFPTPAGIDIAGSTGLLPASAAIQADWSLWLIGCVVAWGLLPRLISLAVCLAWLHARLRQLRIDPALPGWLELRERLLPTHQHLGIDRPAPTARAGLAPAHAAPARGAHAAVLACELGPDLAWPPPGLPPEVIDLGRCDSRVDRARIRQTLDAHHLLLVCDARLTPDRGTAHWLDELRHACPQLRVLCLGGSPEHQALWRHALGQQALAQVSSVQDWLAHLGTSPHE